MKIVSYNLNGIRAAIKKDWLKWVKNGKYDIVCVQETKAQPEDLPNELFEELGYTAYWHSAEKKGYSGVLTLTKVKPDKVVVGCGIKKYDKEGRILRLDFGDWSLLNCYFPSGSSGEERQAFKMKFLVDFKRWIKKVKVERPKLIIVGDYNIAHGEFDIHNPTRKDEPSGFKKEERAWIDKFLKLGFTDAFRFMNPEKIEFSWWSYRMGARKKNKGWRIDYQCVTENLEDKIISASNMNDAVHSDHCPVLLEIDL